MVVSNRLQLDDGRCGSPGIESWAPMPSKEPPSPRSFSRTHHNRHANRLVDHEVLRQSLFAGNCIGELSGALLRGSGLLSELQRAKRSLVFVFLMARFASWCWRSFPVERPRYHPPNSNNAYR
jgi:hypothetical protein